jgi:hypothetical protein
MLAIRTEGSYGLLVGYIAVLSVPRLCRVCQEEGSVFREVRGSVTLSRKVYMYMCPIPNGFGDKAISLYSSKIVVRKRYYVLFLIAVFIVQVIMLVQFT